MNWQRPKTDWVLTPDAERILGIPRDTLKRRYAAPGGFLVEGTHWRRGMHANSPYGWNIPLCIAALEEQGHIFTTEAQG